MVTEELKYDNARKRMYLSTIEDLYNREIIAYKISDNLDMSFVDQTLGEAFKKVKTSEFKNLIIHSNQGFHYKSNIYKSILKKYDTCRIQVPYNFIDSLLLSCLLFRYQFNI